MTSEAVTFKKEEWKESDTCWISLIPQDTEKWQLLHRGRITGRHAAVASGRICYTESDKPENLALSIIGHPISEKSDHIPLLISEGSDRSKKFALGKKAETLIRPWYEKTQKKKITEIGLAVWKKDPFIGASPDGLIEDCDSIGESNRECNNGGKDKGIIEIKYKTDMPSTLCYQAKVSNGQISKSFAHIPRRDFDQMQHTMGVLGRQFCDYIVISPNVGIYMERIPFNQEFFDSLISEYNKFKDRYLLPLIDKHSVKVIPPNENFP